MPSPLDIEYCKRHCKQYYTGAYNLMSLNCKYEGTDKCYLKNPTGNDINTSEMMNEMIERILNEKPNITMDQNAKKEVTKEQIIDVVENNPNLTFAGTINRIVTEAIETQEKFIFKTMSSFSKDVTQMEITKKDLKDALTMWKDFQPVEPWQKDAVWLCGNCEKEVVGWDDDVTSEEYRYPYCRQCGRPVKWK